MTNSLMFISVRIFMRRHPWVTPPESAVRKMGSQVPGLIVSPAGLSTFLRNSPLMSFEQIVQFLARIEG
jgi:hypothetical protein